MDNRTTESLPEQSPTPEPFEIFTSLFPAVYGDSKDPIVQELIKVLKTTDSKAEIKSWVFENFQRFEPETRELLIQMVLQNALVHRVEDPPSDSRWLKEFYSEDEKNTDPQTRALLVFALMKLDQVKEIFAPIIRNAYFDRAKRKRFLKESKNLIPELEKAFPKDQLHIFNHPKYKRAFDEFSKYITEARAELANIR